MFRLYCSLFLSLSGNVVEAVRHARQINREIRLAQSMNPSELYGYAKQLGVPLDLLQKTAKLGRLPVVNFAAGGLGEFPLQLLSNIHDYDAIFYDG